MSEYGKGYAYCLGLFLAHAERGDYKWFAGHNTVNMNEGLARAWFHSASQHLHDLKIPSCLPKIKRDEIKKFRGTCKGMAKNSAATCKDIQNALDQAKELLLEWDVFHGIESAKATRGN